MHSEKRRAFFLLFISFNLERLSTFLPDIRFRIVENGRRSHAAGLTLRRASLLWRFGFNPFAAALMSSTHARVVHSAISALEIVLCVCVCVCVI